jgi:aspartate aminotransferase-like enzyme
MNTLSDVTLFTPGPVNVPSSVLMAGARKMIHHRTPEFSAILESVIERIKVVFGTQEDVLLVHTSGRGAMEGALRNLFSEGDKILCICNGYFGEMFANIAEISNLNVTRAFESWLHPLDLDALEQILKKDPSIKAVTLVHSDTSTAVLNPIKKIGEIVRRKTASQKGLMAPAGISFVALNQRAWKAVAIAENSSFYIDFKKIKDFYSEKKETPGSTPVSIVASVNESLNLIFQEGLDARYGRHKNISSAVKSAFESMGLDLFPRGNFIRSDSLSAFYAPNGILPEKIKKIAREKYYIAIASGLGGYKNETFRIGHLGMINIQQALTLTSAFEFILKELGVSDNIGKGLTRFFKFINAD